MENVAVQTKFEAEVNPTAKKKGSVRIAKGHPASPGVSIGPCRVIAKREDLRTVKKDEILVCRRAIRDLTSCMDQLKGLVTETGGAGAFAAHYARECDVPFVAGVNDIMASVTDGQIIRIDGSKGTVSLL